MIRLAQTSAALLRFPILVALLLLFACWLTMLELREVWRVEG